MRKAEKKEKNPVRLLARQTDGAIFIGVRGENSVYSQRQICPRS